jgi:hypothetical protein
MSNSKEKNARSQINFKTETRLKNFTQNQCTINQLWKFYPLK